MSAAHQRTARAESAAAALQCDLESARAELQSAYGAVCMKGVRIISGLMSDVM
jgi:hypothetical protein